MKIGALISGGKDSIYAAYKESKKHELVCLISLKSKRDDSYMFHIPNIHLVEQIAESMELPLVFIESSGIKEKELEDLEKAIKIAIEKYKIEGIVSGAIKSNYQKERVDNICKKLRLKSIAPLWHVDEEEYMHELIRNNFKVIITGIAAEGLDKSFLGKTINEKTIEELKELNKENNINISGEGGEFETLVLDCQLYKKRIEIKDFEITMENEFAGKYLIKNSKLV